MKGANHPNGGHMGLAPESTALDAEYIDLYNKFYDFVNTVWVTIGNSPHTWESTNDVLKDVANLNESAVYLTETHEDKEG